MYRTTGYPIDPGFRQAYRGPREARLRRLAARLLRRA
jgi:hypothetical protein